MSSDNLRPEIDKLLNSAVNDKLDEYSIDILSGNEKGAGYLSDIIFMKLVNKNTKDEKQLIVKQALTQDGKFLEISSAPFENEIYFYEIISPALKKFQKDATGNVLSSIPQCFATSPGRIVLENLKSQDFILFDKTKCFDDDHVNLLCETYGEYHALSMAFREQHPEEYFQLAKPLLPIWETFNEEGFAHVIHANFKANEEYFDPKLEKSILEKLNIYNNNGYGLFRESLKYEGPNCVLLHGDCWSNNMMFKYKEGKPVDVRLVDFQLVRSDTPVYDLSYNLYSGASKEIFDKLDYYLKVYHNSLSRTLKQLGCDSEKLYSFDTLKQEWKKYSKFGFIMAVTLWRNKLAAKDDTLDVAKPRTKYPQRIEEGKEDYHKNITRSLVFHMFENSYL